MRLRWLTIFLDFPPGDFERGVAFWQQVTGSGLSERRGPDGEFATLLPPDGDPYLRVQRVQDGPGGCHLDLHVDQPLDDAAAEAVALGGTVRYREAGEVIIVESPGGFAFCFVSWNGEKRVPGPVAASRVSQFCLDIPPDGFDRERGFWAKLLGEPSGMPAGLIFQRRDQPAPGDRVTGHVDIGCGDQPGTVARHEAAGARVREKHSTWTVMADPVKRPYCLCRAGVCACA
ncbi:MAG: hypothetical protein FWE35_23655 [Streptosporangiales bacterium]|nr:hypothetical protein [Streptosporangiales bacterium]